MNTFMRKIFLFYLLVNGFIINHPFAYEDPRKFPDVDPKYIDIDVF